jgi:hypothetical protein
MGHLRVGRLPKSRKWRAIVADVASFSGDPNAVGHIVGKTSFAVTESFRNLQNDSSVGKTFTFLLALIVGSKSIQSSFSIR